MSTTTVRVDHQAAIESIDRIAAATGIAVDSTTGYEVCICRDGEHNLLDRIIGTFSTVEEARTERSYTPASHILAVERRVLVAPAREVAP